MKNFNYILLPAYFFLSTTGFAQKRVLDSLQKLLPLTQDSARVKALIDIGCWYANVSNTGNSKDSTLVYLNRAYQEAVRVNYTKGIANTLLSSGYYEMFRHHFSASERFARKSIPYYEKIGYDQYVADAHGLLGYVLYQQGYFDDAIAHWQTFLSFTRPITDRDKKNVSRALEHMGVTYGLKGELEKGLEHAQKGFVEGQQRNDSLGMAFPKTIIGDLYESMGDHAMALEYYYASADLGGTADLYLLLQIAAVHNAMQQYDSALYYHQKALARDTANNYAHIVLGEIYLHQKKYREALDMFKRAALFLKTNNGRKDLLRVLPDMAKVYAAQKNYQAALYYAQQGLALAQATGARQYIADDLKLLSAIYGTMGVSKSAFFYLKQYMALKDSLLSDQLKAKLFGYKSKVENEKKQDQIEGLKKEKLVSQQQLQLQQQRLQQASLLRKILIAGIFSFVLLDIILFRNSILKRRNEKLQNERTQAALQQKTVELEMQALRAQMNPHFIFNCLSSINAFILKNESESASDYLTKFSRLIRMVLANSKKIVIPLEDELEMLRLYLEMERLRFQYSFNYTINFKNEIDGENIFIPPLLLQPFAENAIWHGLMHKEGNGHLDIELGVEEKILTCTITDNGIGRHKAGMIKSKSAEKQKSMGLQITAERLALLNQEEETKTFFNIEDLSDEEGNAAGTRVILKMHYVDVIETIAELH